MLDVVLALAAANKLKPQPQRYLVAASLPAGRTIEKKLSSNVIFCITLNVCSLC
jgi:hypothetical protein